MMKRLFALLIAIILMLTITGSAFAAAAPSGSNGKAPPGLTKIVFIHYPKGLEIKGGTPAKPPKPGDSEGKLWYSDTGIHWNSPAATYMYDSTGEPGNVLDAIQAGFDVWENVAGASFNFVYDNSAVSGISSLFDETDSKNVVGWADLNAYGFSNAIAVTMVWYNSSKLIVEIDMAFNNNARFTWHVNPPGEIWTSVGTSQYDVDVQNIATHEAGHWLMLGDMYNKPASTQTMYGISAEFDLQKRSLESGDKAGIIGIYPAP